jgi:hypothetical protein
MTTLEKVIYLADYMEPSRDFEGVETLRALAEKSLDAAVALGLEMTVREMDERALPVHPNTLKASEWLKGSYRGHGKKREEAYPQADHPPPNSDPGIGMRGAAVPVCGV